VAQLQCLLIFGVKVMVSLQANNNISLQVPFRGHAQQGLQLSVLSVLEEAVVVVTTTQGHVVVVAAG
jgi:hypothetical protein